MAFQIDEEKLKSVTESKKWTIAEIFREFFAIIVDTIQWFFTAFRTIGILLIVVLAVCLVIYVGGAILGILKFGWRQL